MFCTKCGTRLEEGSSFCTNCGARVGADPSSGAPASSPTEKIAPQPLSSAEPGQTAQMPPQQSASTGFAPDGLSFAQGSQSPAEGNVPPVSAPPAAPGGNSSEPGKDKRPVIIAVIVAVAVLLIAAIVAIVLVTSGGQGQDPAAQEGGNAQTGSSTAQTTQVQLFVSQIDNSSFPEVSMYVRLTDASGGQLQSVDASQFSVVEVTSDGTEHQATINEILPMSEGDMMNINLVLDQSASMDSSGKMENAKSAARSFISEITSSGTNYAEITSFDDDVYNVQPFTNDAALLNSAVESLRPTGDTALYDALYWAVQRTNMKTGSRVVIAFTDGMENDSVYTRSDVEEISRLTGIPVYLVGIGDNIDYSELQSLATSCNGQYYDASTSDLASALQSIYESIYSDQRSMYRVAYTSSFEDATSSYRTVRFSCADGSAYSGSVETTYMPVDNVDAYDNQGNLNEYVLPDSGSRYYSRDELEQLSLWELYLARNEIFARYGRGFKNQDLVDYFATRSWYSQKYTPEEFDSMASPLNDYELKNTQMMLEIENERNSPYV